MRQEFHVSHAIDKEFKMRTVSFISRLTIAATAAALPAGAADAGLVFDSFNASGQVALAGGSISQTMVESVPNTSASSAGIAPVAGSRNTRVARAGWQSYGDVFYSDQQKAARYANTIVDTTIGAAVFGFGGKVDVARSSLSYAAQVGSWMDFSSNGYGIGLEGALTGATGISNPYYVHPVLTVRCWRTSPTSRSSRRRTIRSPLRQRWTSRRSCPCQSTSSTSTTAWAAHPTWWARTS
jgi:hypothetical protein